MNATNTSGVVLFQECSGNNYCFQWEKIDTVTLRGKETQMELFSVISVTESFRRSPGENTELIIK